MSATHKCFLASTNVKMYPSAYRDFNNGGDRESLFNSENHIINTKKLSNVIESFSYEETIDGTAYLVLYIKGYYFRVLKSVIPTEAGKDIYAYIKLISHNVKDSSNNTVYTQYMLGNIYSSSVGTLDISNGSSYEFQGLGFATEGVPSNCIGIKVRDSSGNIVTQPLKLDITEIKDNVTGKAYNEVVVIGGANAKLTIPNNEVSLIAGTYTDSATTSNDTSATANTLVKRDASGNITANQFIGGLSSKTSVASNDTLVVIDDATSNVKSVTNAKFDGSGYKFLNANGSFVTLSGLVGNGLNYNSTDNALEVKTKTNDCVKNGTNGVYLDYGNEFTLDSNNKLKLNVGTGQGMVGLSNNHPYVELNDLTVSKFTSTNICFTYLYNLDESSNVTFDDIRKAVVFKSFGLWSHLVHLDYTYSGQSVHIVFHALDSDELDALNGSACNTVTNLKSLLLNTGECIANGVYATGTGTSMEKYNVISVNINGNNLIIKYISGDTIQTLTISTSTTSYFTLSDTVTPLHTPAVI